MFKTYQEALDFLYSNLPVFQKTGNKALKIGLSGIENLMTLLGHPHRGFKSIHIGGTNGKGSHAHLIRIGLQTMGYKVGIYTSPHLQEFSERIQIGNQTIDPNYVLSFVNTYYAYIERYKPSFFEITVAMAFWYFAQKNVDWAVVEVGLGGRLDSTNILNPKLALITNIDYDHCEVLGNTLAKIAVEKAGIMKKNTPIVIGKRHAETDQVFENEAKKKQSKLYFSEDNLKAKWTKNKDIQLFTKDNKKVGQAISFPIKADYQRENIRNVYKVFKILSDKGYISFSYKKFKQALESTNLHQSLKGRWQYLQKSPLIICDIAHNEAGIRKVMLQLQNLDYKKLHLVIGLSNNKDLEKILILLPQQAIYYFTKANLPRALSEVLLFEKAGKVGLQGNSYPSVLEAFKKAQTTANPEDCIFIGGSIFVVGELLNSQWKLS